MSHIRAVIECEIKRLELILGTVKDPEVIAWAADRLTVIILLNHMRLQEPVTKPPEGMKKFARHPY